MDKRVKLDAQINDLRAKLEWTAQQHKYNFMHPKVLRLSQKLDVLIVSLMNKQNEAAPPFIL